MEPIVITSQIDSDAVSVQDSGQAFIIEISDAAVSDEVFVRLQSWDETLKHELLKALVGHTVRVTLEVVDLTKICPTCGTVPVAHEIDYKCDLCGQHVCDGHFGEGWG